MRIDAYTKVVLTVIAACLVSLGGPWLVTSVAAQDNRANRVVLAGWIDATGSLRSMTSEPPAIAVRPITH